MKGAGCMDDVVGWKEHSDVRNVFKAARKFSFDYSSSEVA